MAATGWKVVISAYDVLGIICIILQYDVYTICQYDIETCLIVEQFTINMRIDVDKS